MTIYKLKPPVVDAVQWTGENESEMFLFGSGTTVCNNGTTRWLEVRMNGQRNVRLRVGDYLYAASDGEIKWADQHTFEAMYEKA